MASTAAFCSPGSGWAASLKTRWASGLERLAGRAEVVGVAGAPAAAVVAPGTKVCAGPPSEPDPHPAASRASAATATAPLVDLRIEFLSWSSGQLAVVPPLAATDRRHDGSSSSISASVSGCSSSRAGSAATRASSSETTARRRKLSPVGDVGDPRGHLVLQVLLGEPGVAPRPARLEQPPAHQRKRLLEIGLLASGRGRGELDQRLEHRPVGADLRAEPQPPVRLDPQVGVAGGIAPEPVAQARHGR